ncbi:MAG: YdbL family protein [Nibricoccus sp.]
MKKFVLGTLFLVLTLGFAMPLQAEDLGTVKTRMEQRLAQVDALKNKGSVGENNRGFLEARAGDADVVVAAENKDREIVYAALAKQTGSSADLVGRTRAKQIAQRAHAGEWIQDERGDWKQK